ncbi:hypothetical protein EYF80_048726 [Liparis tanakae]|uniref:Uncharacterized protein n=1 Tax=Liparis tanakae TaxID=230148 RepID=A0A4Z2FLE3_9TELE|nr:hypothetical protein EYF80_048726 [Liparis tanakae]
MFIKENEKTVKRGATPPQPIELMEDKVLIFILAGQTQKCYLVLTGIRQGTESRMQELVPGSAGSTMTKGRSSRVTTRRCWESSSGFRKEP